jgi:histidinol-phosphatase
MDAISTRNMLLITTAERVSAFVLTHFFDKKFTISTKMDGSEVTNVDLEAETLAKGVILDAFPEDGFLGEEHGEVCGTTGFRWVIDPIDGTASFARGVPLFGTLIGLEHNGEPVAGVVNMPAMNETISAVLGEGVIYQAKQCEGVSSTRSLEDAMVCTTSYDYFTQTNSSALYSKLLDCGCSIRGWSDCYAYMLLCTGRIDGVVEPLLKPWDIIPWLPIIKESGGTYSPIIDGGIASNHNLHDSLCLALSCTT